MRTFSNVLAQNSHQPQALTILGLGHFMIGTNPWYVRIFNPILGLEGTESQGVEELQRAAEFGNTDAKFLLKSVLIREGRFPEALALLQALFASYSRNISFQMQTAQLLARLGRKTEATKIFSDILTRVNNDKRIDPRYTPLKIEEIERQTNLVH